MVILKMMMLVVFLAKAALWCFSNFHQIVSIVFVILFEMFLSSFEKIQLFRIGVKLSYKPRWLQI